MSYLLHWTCALCKRQQETKIETGNAWPTVCEKCRAQAR